MLTNKSFTGANGTSPYNLHVDISCMKIIGSTAFFGGTTKTTNDPNLVDAVYFSVEDNGEPGKGIDRISRVFFFDDPPRPVTPSCARAMSSGTSRSRRSRPATSRSSSSN